MTIRRFLTLAAASALALGGLSGCATSFQADVSRFNSELPPPEQGQSFTVMPDNPKYAGSLEFGHYADLVAQRLGSYGYKHSDDPAAAQLVVHLDYGIDKGTQRVRSTGYYPYDPFYYDPFFYPYAYSPYWRGRYAYGYYDPWLWGDYPETESYVVFQSYLTVKIDTTAGKRVFEGTARAQSLSNQLTYLVPNLIDALFTNFPGKNGEEIKVTVPPPPKK